MPVVSVAYGMQDVELLFNKKQKSFEMALIMINGLNPLFFCEGFFVPKPE